jgi:hypothetical protein
MYYSHSSLKKNSGTENGSPFLKRANRETIPDPPSLHCFTNNTRPVFPDPLGNTKDHVHTPDRWLLPFYWAGSFWWARLSICVRWKVTFAYSSLTNRSRPVGPKFRARRQVQCLQWLSYPRFDNIQTGLISVSNLAPYHASSFVRTVIQQIPRDIFNQYTPCRKNMQALLCSNFCSMYW